MYKSKLFTAFIVAGLLLIAGCKKDKDSKQGLFVSTSTMTNIALDSSSGNILAKASGDVDFVGAENITERGFCWASTSDPTTSNSKIISSGVTSGNFTADLTGLTFATTYYVKSYVISNGITYYGNEVKFLASVPVELIKNGNFELPADPAVVLVNEVPDWKTDETDAGLIGRGTDSRNPTNYFWTYSTSKSFYQVVGTVPSTASDFTISFDGNYDWTDWGNGYEATIGVIFSAYSGSDPKTRVVIDTVKIGSGGFPGWGNNWGPKTATFSIPAGSALAGQNLVIEFDLLPYVDPSNGDLWDDTVWYDFDNLSVIQTLK